MSKLSSYCKAYPASLLRRYPGWSEKLPPAGIAGDADTVDEEYFYIHDDYTVTVGAFVDRDVAFDATTEEWKRFCSEQLGFEVPAEIVDIQTDESPTGHDS